MENNIKEKVADFEKYKEYKKIFVVLTIVLFFIFSFIYSVIKTNIGYRGDQWQFLLFITTIIPLFFIFIILVCNTIFAFHLYRSKNSSIFVIFLSFVCISIFCLLLEMSIYTLFNG